MSQIFDLGLRFCFTKSRKFTYHMKEKKKVLFFNVSQLFVHNLVAEMLSKGANHAAPTVVYP